MESLTKDDTKVIKHKNLVYRIKEAVVRNPAIESEHLPLNLSLHQPCARRVASGRQPAKHCNPQLSQK